VDPLTVVAGLSAVAATAGLGTGLRLGRRLRRAEAIAARLRRELHSERHAAYHDSLTGLPNRRAFHQLGAALVNDQVRPAVVCVVVDLNSLKQINDTLGHAAGDRVLVTVAGRLATYAGDDLVARLGGDEFAGLFTSPSVGWRLLYPAAEDLTEMLAAPMSVAGRSLRVTAAVGVAPVRPGTGLAVALHQADCAMYRAKATGVGVACFHPALDDDPTLPPDLRPAGWARPAPSWARPGPARATGAPPPATGAAPRDRRSRSLVESARGGDESSW
jgi:diguanylate cyclase (GGDEF)-like protein